MNDAKTVYPTTAQRAEITACGYRVPALAEIEALVERAVAVGDRFTIACARRVLAGAVDADLLAIAMCF